MQPLNSIEEVVGGASWVQQSDVISGGTGPHYYVELYASPHHFDHLYLMDASMKESQDGGKTWSAVNSEHRHGDNHAMAFKPSDPNYVLLGTDGGVYESFDLTKNWRYMPNLPITQYYKLAVDDAEPFYNIYSGTQDNSTQGGPSRTDNVQGIQNSDWKVILNWDGHAPATEPGNPDIVYAERQEGNLSRVDISTGEVVDIQPQRGRSQKMAGLIVDMRIKKTKKGDNLCILTLDDRSARMDITLFGDVYDSARSIINKDVVLIIEGEVAPDEYNGGVRARGQSVMSVTQARARHASHIEIQCDQQQLSNARIKTLKECLMKSQQSADRISIALRFQREDAEGDLRLGDAWQPEPSDEQIIALKELFGNAAVRLVWPEH